MATVLPASVLADIDRALASPSPRAAVAATLQRLADGAYADGVREGGERAAAVIYDALMPEHRAAFAAVQAHMARVRNIAL
jgi:hypothetical protein